MRITRELVLGAVVLAAAFPLTAAAEPPPCKRWQHDLSDCEILKAPDPNDCEVKGWQTEFINSVRYASAAVFACKNYLKTVHPYVGNNFEVWPIDGNTSNKTVIDDPNYDAAYCVWDSQPVSDDGNPANDGDGDFDWADISQASKIVYLLNATPDPHCFCTANGPYTNIPWSEQVADWEYDGVTERHYFPEALKAAVLQKNFADGPDAFHSNAPFDTEQALQKTEILADNAAELDHIIPRVDSKGCVCGDASPNNIAVISRSMNASMSNTSPKWSSDRSGMYGLFVSCRDPSVGSFVGPNKIVVPPSFPLSQMQLDESSYCVDMGRLMKSAGPPAPAEATQSGGCSTTNTGPAVGLGGLALALLTLRRRGASRRRR